MVNRVRALPLLSLSFLAACSAGAGESTSASTSALTIIEPIVYEPVDIVTQVSVQPTDTTIAFSFDVVGATMPVSVVLTGPGGSTITGTSSALFTGLTPCLSYTYAIQSGGATLAGGSGQVNTRFSGTSACSTTESIQADTSWGFQGLEHQPSNSCSDPYSSYPDGSGWRVNEATGGSYASAEFGYQHFSNSSIFCGTSTVHAWRSQLRYDISPSQWARTVTNASFTANLAGQSGCATTVTTLQTQPWPQTSEGGEWAPLMGGPETSTGLVINSNGQPTYPIVQSGRAISVNFGTPTTTVIFAGFAASNDGFIDQNPAYGGPTSYATDNNDCLSSISSAQVTLTYAELPPDTPTNCVQSVDCGTLTITCENAPDYFTLVHTDPSGVNYDDMSLQGSAAGGSIALSGAYDTGTYKVCATTNAGDAATVCTNNFAQGTNTACPAPPSGVTNGFNPTPPRGPRPM